jgi:hypothetical protein
MKNRALLLLVGLALCLTSSCGLISGVRELTNSATTLLEDAGDLLRLIDSKVESGDLSRELGDLLDQRIENLMTQLQDTIEQSGGVLFDGINGTVDNTFANLSSLLAQIKQGILDESVPALLETLSSQLQLQINLLGGQVEDIIVLTFGNTFVLVDKATNSVVIISCIVLLAIGLLILAVVLIRRKRKPTTLNIIGLVLASIYILFFLCMILITPLRGYVIAGFDFGEKVEGTELKPKVRGVVPETFVLGKSKRIIVYGHHLDKIEEAKIHLYQANQQKFTFPKRTFVEATRNRIILGNFGQTLQWAVPSYQAFQKAVIPASATTDVIEKYTALSYKTAEILYPGRGTPRTGGTGPVTPPAPPEPVRVAPVPMGAEPVRRELRAMPRAAFRMGEFARTREKTLTAIFGQAQIAPIKKKITGFFLSVFKLPEGDFGLRVHDGQDPVESPQFITVFNPPPPPPKPDIWPMNLSWTGGAHAIQGEYATLTLRLGFAHPEEVKNTFSVRITASPSVGTITHQVSSGDIAAAGANNFIDVKTRSFRPSQSGNYGFQVQVDNTNRVDERYEGNNELTKTLSVKRYVYDAKVHFTTFQARKNYDYYTDEYRIKVRVDVSRHSPWEFRIKQNGEPGRVYNVNQARTFTTLGPGDNIAFTTSGYEEDDPDPDDSMGSANYTMPLGNQPTSNRDSDERSIRLQASGYYLSAKVTFTRRAI